MALALRNIVRVSALILIGLLVHPAIAQDTYTVATDRAALVALYNATDGANWNRNANWLTDETLDNWQGVSTNSDGRVNGLSISSNNMNGALPSELGNLSEMDVLMIASSSLSGSLPSSLGNLSKMRLLILSGNNLSGSIPAQLGNLDALLYLGLERNSLSGSVPSELGNMDNLQYLLLSGNSLTGCIPAALSGVTTDAHGLPYCAAATATNTTVPTATQTSAPANDTPVPTDTPAPTDTPVPTDTSVPPTSTPLPTNTPLPPTDTPAPTNTTVPADAQAVSNVQLTSNQAGVLAVTWDAPSQTPSDYRIAWAKDDEDFKNVQDTSGNAFPTSPSYTITGLDGGVRYKLKVRSRYSGERNGGWTDEYSAVVAS